MAKSFKVEKIVPAIQGAVALDEGTFVGSADAYTSALKEAGIKADVANQVNQFNQQFPEWSLRAVKDDVVAHFSENKDVSSVSARFETGTDGFTFEHTISRDEGAADGFDVYSSIINELENAEDDNLLIDAQIELIGALAELSSDGGEEAEEDAA